MLERRALLAVRIRNLPILLPFAKQEGFSGRLGRDLGDAAHVLALHGEHQISSPQDGVINLASAMSQAIHALLDQQLLRRSINAMSNQRTETSGGHLDALPLDGLPQHHFCGGTAANVADTYK